MLWKNRNKRVGLCLMVVTSCLVLTAVWIVLATPGTALAKKPDKPPVQDEIIYTVNVVFDDVAFPEGSGLPQAPPYLPSCLAETRGGTLSAWFERHDLCATVTTSTGYTLTDDIGLHIGTDKAENIISFQLIGQDVIGTEGLIHRSEIVTIDPPVVPSLEGFILHIDTDNLEIWKYDKHLNTRGAKPVEMVGYISICDLVYTPQP
ncbi:hypothetical protein ACFL3Q_16565 [Planctomycetota bacterium]